MMEEIGMLRHAQTYGNLNRQLSHYDTQISPEWKERLTQRAQSNKGKFDGFVLVSNGQPRCREVYDVLSAYNTLSAGIIDTRFDERNFWIFAEQTKEDVIEFLQLAYPELYELLWDKFSRWMDQELVDVFWKPLYESNNSVRNRVETALIDVMDNQFPWKNLLIITSSGVLRNLQALLLSKTTQEFDDFLEEQTGYNKIPNLAYTNFIRDESSVKYQLQYFNRYDDNERL